VGFLDKVKGAMNAVTGNAAEVTIDYPKVAFAGESIKVKITARSTGAEVKSKGIFVDLVGQERTSLDTQANGQKHHVSESKETYGKEHQIAEAFTLAANETRSWEGSVTLPSNAQPSYDGVHTKHVWQIRGRVEALGNDPDSGFLDLRVGKKD